MKLFGRFAVLYIAAFVASVGCTCNVRTRTGTDRGNEYNDGREAGLGGLPRDACPYPESPDKPITQSDRQDWLSGHNAGVAERAAKTGTTKP